MKIIINKEDKKRQMNSKRCNSNSGYNNNIMIHQIEQKLPLWPTFIGIT